MSPLTARWRTLLDFVVVATLGTIPLAFSIDCEATFHTYRIEQVYSNADRTVQFIVLHESANSSFENRFSGHFIRAEAPAGTNMFVFPQDLPSSETADTRVLIATEGFAALNLVTPDYVVPNGFLSTSVGSVNFSDVDEVSYPALPTDGVMALDRSGASIPNAATNFAGVSASVKASALNYEGLWWNSPAQSESGWGINLAHQGDVIFATGFTYDSTGTAWWLSTTAAKTANATYAGTLYETVGPAFNAVPFDPAQVKPTAVGNATFKFSSEDAGSFTYTVNGVTQSKAITRQVFGIPPNCSFGTTQDMSQATNYQDLWWNVPAGSESGWGVNLTHQGDIIFATWFTYGLDGKPMWLSVTANRTAARTYSGTLNRTTGPAFSAVPFDPHRVAVTAVGTATLTFANGNAGTFAYSVNGVQQAKSITREIFRTPGTLCQ